MAGNTVNVVPDFTDFYAFASFLCVQENSPRVEMILSLRDKRLCGIIQNSQPIKA